MLAQRPLKKFFTLVSSLALLTFLASVGMAQTFDTNSPNQLKIYSVALSNPNGGNPHCEEDDTPPNPNPNAFKAGRRTLTIVGENFTTGPSLPARVFIGGAQVPQEDVEVVDASTIVVRNLQCQSTIDGDGKVRGRRPARSERLIVATGNGKPHEDGMPFFFSQKGNNGNNGKSFRKGQAKNCGNKGGFALIEVKEDGTDGDSEDICHGENGTHGSNGKGFRKGGVIPASDPSNTCGSAAHVIIPVDENGVDGTPQLICHGKSGDNGRDGAHGRDGAPGQNGQQGPKGDKGENGRNGTAKGWLKNFGQGTAAGVAISSAPSNVLSQVVTGGNGYVVNAKVNAPFGNNAKQVTCSLVAVENGVSTALDSTEALLLGNNTTTAKGVIALGGVYKAQGGEAAAVTISVSCQTGGDARTLNKGAMNITAVDSIEQ